VRRYLSALAVAALAGAAGAEEAAPNSKLEIAPVADKLDVYRDDVGKYYVVPRAGAFGKEGKDYRDWVFYGDGKAMHQQRMIGYSLANGQYDWTVWSPRVRNRTGAELSLASAKLSLACGGKTKRALVLLAPDEAKQLLDRATFRAPLWQRLAHVLARDEDGVYYYVDELRGEAGGSGYRLFAGRKGAMKELPMTDVVVDKAGEIFTTKTGALKIAGDKAVWQKGTGPKAVKTELVVLEPAPNRYVIYRELGVYGELGTVCEDQ
jgi:hypothetical protein